MHITSVMTRKGQVTIPAPIRRALNLQEGDKVIWILEDDQIRLMRAGSVVEATAGLLKGTEPPASAERLREVGEQAMAEAAIERLRQTE
ncbi:MAG: AbrB/MazE/SpoVT family DNA-binding domain-containing protein [Nitrospinota bacterium]|nr:MAG: AbrB/MazE/SpoVT family DNA-binding domain-containing protein [Nitrospinota bacterium]